MSAASVAEAAPGPELWLRRAVPARDVLMRAVEDEAVLLDLTSGRYFGLDPVGTRMWAVMTAADSVGAAFDQLLTEYDVAPEVLRQDLVALIEKLVAHGLLALADA